MYTYVLFEIVKTTKTKSTCILFTRVIIRQHQAFDMLYANNARLIYTQYNTYNVHNIILSLDCLEIQVVDELKGAKKKSSVYVIYNIYYDDTMR